jgi:CRP-like cAMP-binding protein
VAKRAVAFPNVAKQPSIKHDDGRTIENLILRRLPQKECTQFFSSLEFVRLKLHQIIQEPGETIKSCYFLNNGLGSVLTTEPNGKTVEVGLIGKEGFVGLPVIFGFKTSALRVVTQGDGTAYRIGSEELLNVLPTCKELNQRLAQFSMFLAMQSTQLAACNRLHDVDERLARWLLMSQDRIGDTKLPLTQEFLAQMLGTRRASVTVAAGTLQKAGVIEYSRGSVTILDRKGLEKQACNCYEAIERQKEKWQKEARW